MNWHLDYQTLEPIEHIWCFIEKTHAPVLDATLGLGRPRVKSVCCYRLLVWPCVMKHSSLFGQVLKSTEMPNSHWNQQNTSVSLGCVGVQPRPVRDCVTPGYKNLTKIQPHEKPSPVLQWVQCRLGEDFGNVITARCMAKQGRQAQGTSVIHLSVYTFILHSSP